MGDIKISARNVVSGRDSLSEATAAAPANETLESSLGLGGLKDTIDDKRNGLKDQQEKIEKLQEELKEASDKGFFEKIGQWLSGSDGGVGDVNNKVTTTAARSDSKTRLKWPPW
jgi:predicted  nucleic acid-binding Zn-ribbon protein